MGEKRQVQTDQLSRNSPHIFPVVASLTCATATGMHPPLHSSPSPNALTCATAMGMRPFA